MQFVDSPNAIRKNALEKAQAAEIQKETLELLDTAAQNGHFLASVHLWPTDLQKKLIKATKAKETEVYRGTLTHEALFDYALKTAAQILSEMEKSEPDVYWKYQTQQLQALHETAKSNGEEFSIFCALFPKSDLNLPDADGKDNKALAHARTITAVTLVLEAASREVFLPENLGEMKPEETRLQAQLTALGIHRDKLVSSSTTTVTGEIVKNLIRNHTTPEQMHFFAMLQAGLESNTPTGINEQKIKPVEVRQPAPDYSLLRKEIEERLKQDRTEQEARQKKAKASTAKDRRPVKEHETRQLEAPAETPLAVPEASTSAEAKLTQQQENLRQSLRQLEFEKSPKIIKMLADLTDGVDEVYLRRFMNDELRRDEPVPDTALCEALAENIAAALIRFHEHHASELAGTTPNKIDDHIPSASPTIQLEHLPNQANLLAYLRLAAEVPPHVILHASAFADGHQDEAIPENLTISELLKHVEGQVGVKGLDKIAHAIGRKRIYIRGIINGVQTPDREQEQIIRDKARELLGLNNNKPTEPDKKDPANEQLPLDYEAEREEISRLIQEYDISITSIYEHIEGSGWYREAIANFLENGYVPKNADVSVLVESVHTLANLKERQRTLCKKIQKKLAGLSGVEIGKFREFYTFSHDTLYEIRNGNVVTIPPEDLESFYTKITEEVEEYEGENAVEHMRKLIDELSDLINRMEMHSISNITQPEQQRDFHSIYTRIQVQSLKNQQPCRLDFAVIHTLITRTKMALRHETEHRGVYKRLAWLINSTIHWSPKHASRTLGISKELLHSIAAGQLPKRGLTDERLEQITQYFEEQQKQNAAAARFFHLAFQLLYPVNKGCSPKALAGAVPVFSFNTYEDLRKGKPVYTLDPDKVEQGLPMLEALAQLENPVEVITGIYEGKIRPEDILNEDPTLDE